MYPHLVKNRQLFQFLLPDQWKFMEGALDIIIALRKNPLTAREIQNYYINHKKNQPYSLKSTYRLIQKLEKHGLIKRIAVLEGSRFPEYLYDRTAVLYFPEPQSNAIERWNNGNGRDYTDSLAFLLSELSGSKPDLTAFYTIFSEFTIKQHNIIAELLERAKTDSKLAHHYSSTHIDQINEMHQYASILFVLFQDAKYFTAFKRIFST